MNYYFCYFEKRKGITIIQLSEKSSVMQSGSINMKYSSIFGENMPKRFKHDMYKRLAEYPGPKNLFNEWYQYGSLSYPAKEEYFYTIIPKNTVEEAKTSFKLKLETYFCKRRDELKARANDYNDEYEAVYQIPDSAINVILPPDLDDVLRKMILEYDSNHSDSHKEDFPKRAVIEKSNRITIIDTDKPEQFLRNKLEYFIKESCLVELKKDLRDLLTECNNLDDILKLCKIDYSTGAGLSCSINEKTYSYEIVPIEKENVNQELVEENELDGEMEM